VAVADAAGHHVSQQRGRYPARRGGCQREKMIRVPARSGRQHSRPLFAHHRTAPKASGMGARDLAVAIERCAVRNAGADGLIHPGDFLGRSTGCVRCGRSLARHEVLASEVLDPRDVDLPEHSATSSCDSESVSTREFFTIDEQLRETSAKAAAAASRRRERAMRQLRSTAVVAAHRSRLDRRPSFARRSRRRGSLAVRQWTGLFTTRAAAPRRVCYDIAASWAVTLSRFRPPWFFLFLLVGFSAAGALHRRALGPSSRNAALRQQGAAGALAPHNPLGGVTCRPSRVVAAAFPIAMAGPTHDYEFHEPCGPSCSSSTCRSPCVPPTLKPNIGGRRRSPPEFAGDLTPRYQPVADRPSGDRDRSGAADDQPGCDQAALEKLQFADRPPLGRGSSRRLQANLHRGAR